MNEIRVPEGMLIYQCSNLAHKGSRSVGHCHGLNGTSLVSLCHLNTWSPVGGYLESIRSCSLTEGSMSLGVGLGVSEDSCFISS